MEANPVFIQVGALADGFAPDNHVLAPVGDLAGRTLTLDAPGATPRAYHFVSATTLHWREGEGDGEGAASGEAAYRATRLRDGLYFVDYLDPTRRAAATSVVLDLADGLWTSIDGVLPTEADAHLDALTRVERGLPLTAVEASFRHGTIEGVPTRGPLHAPTDELIGKRTMYRYSATECYEHIYLNAHFYAWQCLSGVEAELADVDRCHYFKLADQLYLFVWREKIVPTLGVVLIDLAQRKTDGKIFGYRGGDFGALSNFPVGAHATVLNETVYPLER